MTIPEPLTKENFWNDMAIRFPNAMRSFGEWIDAYKKAINWQAAFNTPMPPKFHDLPYDLQLGIWMRYNVDRGGCQMKIEDFFEFDLREDIEKFFEHILEPEAKYYYHSHA